MKKQMNLAPPAPWINSRYYELQSANTVPAIEEEVNTFSMTVKEGVKIGIGAFTVYLIIAMAIIIL